MKILPYRPPVGPREPSSSMMAVKSGSFPVIPGAANTQEKVLNVYRLYPWIWEDINSLGMQGTDLLRMLEQIWTHDRQIFHKTVQELKGEEIDIHTNPTEQTRLKRLAGETSPTSLRLLVVKFVTGLRDHYFGTGKLLHIILKIKYKDLSCLKSDELEALSRTLDSLSLVMKPHKAELWLYFIARATYPDRFGFRPPPSPTGTPRTSFDPFQSSVKVTRRPNELPERIAEYGPQGEEIWIELIRNIDPKLFKDSAALRIILQRARTRYISHWELPLEMTVRDLTDAQIQTVLNELLDRTRHREADGKNAEARPVFGGNRIRVMVESSQEGTSEGAWKKVALREYDVVTLSQAPLHREAVLKTQKTWKK